MVCRYMILLVIIILFQVFDDDMQTYIDMVKDKSSLVKYYFLHLYDANITL